MPAASTMADPRDVIGCACPRTDSYDCARVRGDKMGVHALFSEDPPPDDEERCDCDCHIRDEDGEP